MYKFHIWRHEIDRWIEVLPSDLSSPTVIPLFITPHPLPTKTQSFVLDFFTYTQLFAPFYHHHPHAWMSEKIFKMGNFNGRQKVWCEKVTGEKGKIDCRPFFKAAGASSQCYWDKLMLLKCELMLLKCQINTNTYKNYFLLPTKCLEEVLKYSYIIWYGCKTHKLILKIRKYQ